MNEHELANALNDCIDRLSGGQSMDDCLRAYPDFADALRPLLEVAQLPRQARPDVAEMNQMRNRLDSYIEHYIDSTDFDSPSWRIPSGGMVFSLVATLVIAIGLLIILRDNSIIVANTPTPTLMITITASETATETSVPTIQPTTIATEIFTETTVPTETSSPALTPTLTMTSMPTNTSIPPSVTPTNTLTLTPTSTRQSITATHTEILVTEGCTLEKPEGWFEYQIRSGDTLSHIAVQSGSTTDTLSDANCIDDARFIVIGQTIFVPQLWEVNITNDTSQSGNEETSSSTTSNSGATSSSDDDNGSSSASDDDDSDDHDDSDDSDNSGSGSDSDNSGSGSDDDD